MNLERISVALCALMVSSLLGCSKEQAKPGPSSIPDDSARPTSAEERRANEAAPGIGGFAAVWVNEGGDKVARGELRASAQNEDVRNSVWDGNKVRVFGARNEIVSFNIVLEAPGGKSVSGVSLKLDSLKGPGGREIRGKPVEGDGVFDWVGRHIELFYVRYLQIRGLSWLAYGNYDERHIPERLRRPWTGEGEGRGQWTDRPDHDAFYPDIAVPLELVGSFDVPAGKSQSIWVDVYIPSGAATGTYRGSVTLSERGAVQGEVPVELTVRDFVLPDAPTAKTMLFLGYGDINQRYLGVGYPTVGSPQERKSRAIRDRHFQLAHRHRISLIDANAPSLDDEPVASWIPRLDGSLFTAERGYEGPGAGTPNGVFSIATYGAWRWKDEGEAGMWRHTDIWASWFEQHSPETELFLYLIDEPGKEAWPKVEAWARWMDDNPGPGSSVKSLTTIPFHRAEQHMPSVDIPTTWAASCLPQSCQQAADRLRSDSEKSFYMYNGYRPFSGSFAIEDEGVALRELAWGQYKKGVERWFYWESTYYNNYQGGAGQTNVFERAQTYGGKDPKPDRIRGLKSWNYMNGDGVLFYPGTDLEYPSVSYGVHGPFASLRLKHWRRGIQDVEYLSLAAKVDPERVERIVQKIVPKVLWEYGVSDERDPTWVKTDISWSTDPDVWEAARAELADIIEARNETREPGQP